MCSSGGPMADIDLKKLKTKKYHCKSCGNSFKGLGKKVVCPSCQSDAVELAEYKFNYFYSKTNFYLLKLTID